MSKFLKLYLAQGVVGNVEGYRAGARHALLVFVMVDKADASDARVLQVLEEAGWLHVDVQKSQPLEGDPDLIEDETLRRAAMHAVRRGQVVVIYRDEIPTDS